MSDDLAMLLCGTMVTILIFAVIVVIVALSQKE